MRSRAGDIDFAGKLGRFEVPLAFDCAAAVENHPDLYVEVQVAGVPQLPRPRAWGGTLCDRGQARLAAAGELAAKLAAYEADIALLKQQDATLTAKRPVIEEDGDTYTLDGLFCGITDQAFNGNIGGLAAAKTHCESKCGEGAHMCTSEEVSRSRAMGGVPVPPLKYAWIATGAQASFADVPKPIFDCAAFTTSDGAYYGNATNSDDYVSLLSCGNMANILCCK